ncbi:MAG: hypothetical protein ABIN58_03625, partial [candidate division WOR-3 bacterium]
MIFLLSALVAIVAMALLFASPQPKPPEAGLSYAEVSRDDPSCEKDICLTEYIIVSNGMVLKVVRHESGQDVSLHVADPGKAVSAIRKISELQDPDTVFEKNAQ